MRTTNSMWLLGGFLGFVACGGKYPIALENPDSGSSSVGSGGSTASGGSGGTSSTTGSGVGVGGSTGVAGSEETGGSSTGVAGSVGAGGSTGVAGSVGAGGSTGVAGSEGTGGSSTSVGGSTGVAGQPIPSPPPVPPCNFGPTDTVPVSAVGAVALKSVVSFLGVAVVPGEGVPDTVDAAWTMRLADSILTKYQTAGAPLPGLTGFLKSWVGLASAGTLFDPWAVRMTSTSLEKFLIWPSTEPHHPGILTEPALLAAYPGISRRGTWLNEVLLCQQIPPPPAGVPVLAPPGPGQTTRQALAMAMTNPSCPACHSVMDPPAFAFEHFDAQGQYRDFDNGQPVDSSGTFNGMNFTSIDDLGPQLGHSCDVGKCFAQSMMNYALGVDPGATGPYTDSEMNAVAMQFTNSGFSIRTLILAIAGSPAFVRR